MSSSASTRSSPARWQAAYGEELSFHPWRTLAAHEPVGSIAEARKVAYSASAELRRNVNGQPLGEPQVPRPDTHQRAAIPSPTMGELDVGLETARTTLPAFSSSSALARSA
jgi:hypothetical protein